MKTKAHLNEDGLEQIRLIKSCMNRGRELPLIIEPVLDEEYVFILILININITIIA